jgi:hypothetical protein
VVLALITPEDLPPSPELQSVSVDLNKGLTHIYFFFDTDEGVSINLTQTLRTSFPCSELLSFNSSNEAMCSFLTPRHLAILPSERLMTSFPLISERVRLLGNTLKPHCPFGEAEEVCGSYPLNVEQELVLKSEDFIVSHVQISILGSHFVSKFEISSIQCIRKFLQSGNRECTSLVANSRRSSSEDLIKLRRCQVGGCTENQLMGSSKEMSACRGRNWIQGSEMRLASAQIPVRQEATPKNNQCRNLQLNPR